MIRDGSESGIRRRTAPFNIKMAQHGELREGALMPFLVSDLLLFFCLAAWVTGMVIAIASLLS